MAEESPSSSSSSSNHMTKSREILATPSHEGLEIIIYHLSMRQETIEYKTALSLYGFIVSTFPNCLTLKLLKVYQCSQDIVVRFKSIHLLSKTLSDLRSRSFELSLVALNEIKPSLISCLKMEGNGDSDFEILRGIVSCVAYDVMILDNEGWEELSECIFSLAGEDSVKAFHVFVDLPPVYCNFIDRFRFRILEKAENVLICPEECSVEKWSLCLETVVKLGLQVLDSEEEEEKEGFDLVKYLLSVIVKSARNVMEKGMSGFLVRGLECLEMFLSRDMNLNGYSKAQRCFVSSLVIKIEGVAKHTKEVVRRINRLVKSRLDPDIIQMQLQEDVKKLELEFGRLWCEHLMNYSSLEVLRIFASTDLEDKTREIAIRRVNVLLSDHTLNVAKIDVSVMTQLQPLLISCLSKKGISDSMFKVLGEVVYHVAYEMFNVHSTWFALHNYIASTCKSEFQRAVYIFSCLTMPLEDDKFVIDMVKDLLAEIITRLNPTKEVYVDWVLAFTGAFCAAIHLADTPSQAESVKEIANKMVDSVKELVGRGKEVGSVRRGFRDVESIVKKQLKWYGPEEYKFIKSMLWRLYAIEGMRIESRIVLWRINAFLERDVAEEDKEMPEIEIDESV
ncbi:unnamed protein product [Cochlearia groenlandica]